MDSRLNRRMLGAVLARTRECNFDRVPDPRWAPGVKWEISGVLNVLTASMAAGSKSLSHAESMSAEMSTACRRKLGIARRIPDTTMRQLLVRLDQAEMRKSLYRQVRAAQAVEEERIGGHILRRSVFVSEDVGVWHKRTEVRTMIRVLFERMDPEHGTIETQQRLYVSSLGADALTARQWITITRNHWNVENNCHHTFDSVFEEDKRPWIVSDSTGMLAVLILRRIAYNILTLFRNVTQRAKDNRLTPWREIIRRFYNAYILVTKEQLKELRIRNLKEELQIP